MGDDPARSRPRRGGGLLNTGGKVTLTNVSLENNIAFGADGGNGVNGVGGGSVGSDGAAASMARAEGGGILNSAGSLTQQQLHLVQSGHGGRAATAARGVGGGSGGISGTNGRSGVGGAWGSRRQRRRCSGRRRFQRGRREARP